MLKLKEGIYELITGFRVYRVYGSGAASIRGFPLSPKPLTLIPT